MPGARPRPAALGLRGRIVGAVLITAVVTLTVAAIALLGPLESSLRSAALKTLKSDLQGVQREFRALNLSYVGITEPGPAAGEALQKDYLKGYGERLLLYSRQQSLATAIGATVQMRWHLDATGRSRSVLLPSDSNVAPETVDGDNGTYGDVAIAYGTNQPRYSFGSINGTEYVRAAIPINRREGFVLAVRKPIDEIPDAVHAVRQAFLYAGLAGLALSLLIGVPLSARLVRRLRQLRVSALRLADGGSFDPVPEDRARDEIGDLARSFAIMQRRIRHQEAARRAFVATASHELRTPLTSLEGMLELLDEDLERPDPDLGDAREMLASARAQSRRLSRLATDLLDLSRIDAEVALRSEPIELGELSRAVLAEFELGTRARGISAALEETGVPIWALGDPGSVARILRILLDNAVRVSPDGSEVTVELAAEPLPALSVRDHGPGVVEAERELIFERFHRGRNTGGDAGFGLGLAIGRELAERMGGTLILEPPDGPGARFTLTLPTARAAQHDPLLTA